MTNTLDLQAVLKASFVADLVKATCGDKTTLIVRTDEHMENPTGAKLAYVLRAQEEGDRDNHRIIILPPRGFTANAPNQMNSHDEAESATIHIMGAVREGKSGFSTLKDCLLIVSAPDDGSASDLSEPYLTFDLNNLAPGFTVAKYSSKQTPSVVKKPDPETKLRLGFYHNLINLSDDWLVLKLHKRLYPQRLPKMESIYAQLPATDADLLRKMHETVISIGDEIFSKKPELVTAVQNLSPLNALMGLSEMIYVRDTGRHEACSVFGTILGIGKKNPALTVNFLNEQLAKKDSIPPYYAKQLIEKIKAHSAKNSRSTTLAAGKFGEAATNAIPMRKRYAGVPNRWALRL